MTIKQVFLVSLLFKKVRGRGGGGRLFEGGAYLLFWPRGWALIRGGALIRAWTFIRGNTVFKTFRRQPPLLGEHLFWHFGKSLTRRLDCN